jgi:hypothetical protein
VSEVSSKYNFVLLPLGWYLYNAGLYTRGHHHHLFWNVTCLLNTQSYVWLHKHYYWGSHLKCYCFETPTKCWAYIHGKFVLNVGVLLLIRSGRNDYNLNHWISTGIKKTKSEKQIHDVGKKSTKQLQIAHGLTM